MTVLDVVQGIAGLHGSMPLALHGADVMKIEPLEGDGGRAPRHRGRAMRPFARRAT